MVEAMVEAMNERAMPGLGVGAVSVSKTVYRIGSVTETLTAIALMRLWEQGALDLGDPVDRYLEGFEVKQLASAPSATCLPTPPA